jgi:hypothetical protein
MTRVLVAVREPGTSTFDYALNFDLPEVPSIGSYISITRPDTKPWSEDLVVRHVWWQLHHPETRGVDSSDSAKGGVVTEIVVECDPAIGPNASDSWRKALEAGATRGMVETFKIERFSVRQSDLSKKA